MPARWLSALRSGSERSPAERPVRPTSRHRPRERAEPESRLESVNMRGPGRTGRMAGDARGGIPGSSRHCVTRPAEFASRRPRCWPRHGLQRSPGRSGQKNRSGALLGCRRDKSVGLKDEGDQPFCPRRVIGIIFPQLIKEESLLVSYSVSEIAGCSNYGQ